MKRVIRDDDHKAGVVKITNKQNNTSGYTMLKLTFVRRNIKVTCVIYKYNTAPVFVHTMNTANTVWKSQSILKDKKYGMFNWNTSPTNLKFMNHETQTRTMKKYRAIKWNLQQNCSYWITRHNTRNGARRNRTQKITLTGYINVIASVFVHTNNTVKTVQRSWLSI